MVEAQTTFAKGLSWTVAIALTMTVASMASARLMPSGSLRGAVGGLFAALGAFAIAVVIEMRASKSTISHALMALGMRPGTGAQLRVAGIGCLPMLLAYFLIFRVFGKSAALEAGAVFLIPKFLIAQGLIEEVVFRGLIFRRLRIDRSFKRAAFLSAILFSLVHLANFSRGLSAEVAFSTFLSMTFAFVLAFPLAAIFELGNGSIWCGALWHVAIDSVNWFQHASEPGPALTTYLVSLIIAGAVVLFQARRLRPLSAAV